MAPRKLYGQQLDEIKRNIIRMGHQTEKMIEMTLKALCTDDKDLAKEVIKADDVIDNMQITMEKDCVAIIAQQQPIASDLRFIISVVKILTDIERIADQCSDICKYRIRLEDKTWSHEVNYQRDIENMANVTKNMLKIVIDSFVTRDRAKISEVSQMDDQIDDAFYKICHELTDKMKVDPDFVENGLKYSMIIKYLERIADHITNIGEWTYYQLTGEYIIHEVNK